MICAWDIQARPAAAATSVTESEASQTNGVRKSKYRQHVQAHTHWINDISLIRSQDALISASSDLSVKIWRPNSGTVHGPQTLGLHSDYVKRVASPSESASWVAAGGLDHKGKYSTQLAGRGLVVYAVFLRHHESGVLDLD